MRKGEADDIVVFLGPTMDLGEAQSYLAAQYRPPAGQGAIIEAARSVRPSAIILIDGVFGRVPAVRHKEILWAMSRGIAVYGAASIGALRAAELAPAGMRGFGLIYRWYRATPFADDDEVAVAMTPRELGSRPLSEALINMRMTLRRAERAGIILGGVRRRLERLAQDLHFLDRTYAALLAAARRTGAEDMGRSLDALEGWIPDHAVDQKRLDAKGILQLLNVRQTSASDLMTPAPFRLTEAWAADLDAAGLLTPDLLSGPDPTAR